MENLGLLKNYVYLYKAVWRIVPSLHDIVETTKRYARLAKGNVRNFQERTARTVYGSRYIAWAGYSFSVQVFLTTSF